jgi:glycosyltransferase involved in cell wall biosynthesis
MADVCMIVEGAYPYITGGVSSWIHALIGNLPNITFAIVHIGARPDPGRQMRYRLPENVVSFQEIFLNDASAVKKPVRKKNVVLKDIQVLHKAIAMGGTYDAEQVIPPLKKSGFVGLTPADLLFASAGWDILISLYKEHAAQQSFVDFFWTFRQTYLPIITLCQARLPDAQVYHAVSTGFSGFSAALTKIRAGRPFLLTEHGLYTREREIEIAQSEWMEQLVANDAEKRQRMNFFQSWWLNIYRFMERLSYDQANVVISITGVNQVYQRSCGAANDKLRLIPNGIDTTQLSGLRVQNTQVKDRFHVGFVGRIVPIKDVKTFLRAIQIAYQKIPELEVYLIGPTDEDEAYYQDCLRLVEMLNLPEIVHFTGRADVKQYYREIDVLVLTSLSEGQPLVILEGNCAGIPVVATNVGACVELLQGVTPEDRSLGVSGLITPVASPQETASAIIQLWRNPALRTRMAEAAMERVRRFYSQEQLYTAYRMLYESFIRR